MTHQTEEDRSQQNADAFRFWKEKLNSARLVVAPMVDQSELPWRLLSRRHGAELCYTPMYHATVFARDSSYRKEALASSPEDRPLIIQFCANDPDTLLKAAQYAEAHCEAIDLNLGCPQAIAKRGHYGAFLQDEWDLIHKMVKLCAEKLKVPITCKMRVFEDVNKTVQYAQMLESAGCKLLTVHGRTREQKGPNTGLASWKHVKAVKAAVKIPVFCNGNIQCLNDVHRCLKETGVEGVMTAEGNLHNPALFEGKEVVTWDLATEYLDLVEQYPCPLSYVRGHLFKLFHHLLLVHTELREVLGSCKSITDVRAVVKRIKEKSLDDVKMYEMNPEEYKEKYQNNLPQPYWICQPYFRPKKDDVEKKERKDPQNTKRHLLDLITGGSELQLSNNKLKKLCRNPNKKFQSREDKFDKCSQCLNPKGLKCQFNLCKACCRKKMYTDLLDCSGHKLYSKARQRKTELQSLCEEKRILEKTDQDGLFPLEDPHLILSKESDSEKDKSIDSEQSVIPESVTT